MVAATATHKTEVISVASGKGGTGKTIILASLGYALQTSGHRVLFIDSDTATDGLSLFILGPRGWEAVSEVESRNILSEYLRSFEESSARLGGPISGFKVNRGRKDDHGQIYELLLSGRGLYGDLSEEIGRPAVPQLTREQFRDAIGLLFDSVRNSNQWDYVLVDTRGGFGFNTTDVCALSDTFFLVTEPDYTSFYQDKNLVYRISAAAAEIARKPVMRGIIVNKATEFWTSGLETSLGIHELNLDKVEANFRNVLVDEFSIRYSDTHPVPLDVEAVNAYKSQKIPYVACPGSIFSYATMVAFSNLMKTVVVPWPEEVTSRWNELVDRVSEAIRSENKRKLSLVNKQKALERERERLNQQNGLLKEQIDQLKKTLERSEKIVTSGREQQEFVRGRFLQDRIFYFFSGSVALLVILTIYFFQQYQKSDLENLTKASAEYQRVLLELLREKDARPLPEAPQQQSPQKQ